MKKIITMWAVLIAVLLVTAPNNDARIGFVMGIIFGLLGTITTVTLYLAERK